MDQAAQARAALEQWQQLFIAHPLHAARLRPKFVGAGVERFGEPVALFGRLFVAVAGLVALLAVDGRCALVELRNFFNVDAGGVGLLDKVNVPVVPAKKYPFIRLANVGMRLLGLIL